jgi:hypothetical protein
VRERAVAFAVGVLVGASIVNTGARVTSGVGLGCRVGSGVGVVISMTRAGVKLGVPISAGQCSRDCCLVRNCATPRPIAQVVETPASPIAHHARR